MKKLFACIALCALLLSLGTVFAAAEDLPDYVSFTPGAYLGGDAEAYAPVGDITVAWLPDVSDRVDMTDGDLSDWYALGLTATNIDAHNMIAWVGDSTVVGDFKITSFAAADPDYFYLAFDIVDDDFAYGASGSVYNGDAIQLALDLGGMLGDLYEREPDALLGFKNIFYSFSCVEDGAPIQIMRQESDQDGLLTEANGDGVKGAARRTELGWSVELALSWEQLYDDYVWRAWAEDSKIYIGSDQALSLRLEACLYYLDRAETGGDIQWAAGTTNGLTDDAGNPVVSWTVYDNSITWTVPYQYDMSFSCGGFVIISGYETIAPETETELPEVNVPAIEDWVETELNTNVEWYETIPPEVEEPLRDAAEDLDAEDELNAILEKYGCTAAVGTGSLTALLTVAAAAYVLKKK